MHIVRDAATLMIVILLALTVRLELNGKAEDVGGLQADEPQEITAQEPTAESAPSTSSGIAASAVHLSVPQRSLVTKLPFPGRSERHVAWDAEDGRILIVIEDEDVERGSPDPQPANVECCETARAGLSC